MALFLSTPSARRATRSAGNAEQHRGYFYPRPPRGGRLHLDVIRKSFFAISIHALREEGDVGTQRKGRKSAISIHALREEGDVYPHGRCHPDDDISIHALREEGDKCWGISKL